MAVKVFDQGLSAEQAAALAQALTRLCEAPLDHPSIVAPHGAGLNGNSAWLAEPYVDATPLDRILTRGPQPVADVLLRVTRVAAALDFAAAAGIYHGALTTRDILVGVDRTLVTGLGVAQALAQAGVDLPASGATVSPQRALALAVSRADDVFALAAIAGEMLYGRPIENRASLSSIVTSVPGLDHIKLRDVLARSLADDPAERPATALEFAEAMQQCILSPAPNAELHDTGSDVSAHVDSAAAAAIPMTIPLNDLPLRAAEPAATHEPAFDSDWESPTGNADAEARNPIPSHARTPAAIPVVPNREFEFESRARAAAQPRSLWLPIASAVAIAFVFGFASGFIVGQRDQIPVPRSAERAIPRAQREAAEEPRPAPTGGQDFTESAVAPEAEGRATESERRAQAVEDAAVLPTEPVPLRRANAGEPAANGPEPSSAGRPEAGEASMEVVSRPAGAQVYVDGRLVGKTPILLPAVDAGDHAVQIALPGHQRWVSRVNVSAGSRARVAASLER